MSSQYDRYLSILVLGILHAFFGFVLLIAAGWVLFSGAAQEIRSYTVFDRIVAAAYVLAGLYLAVGVGLMFVRKSAFVLSWLTLLPWLAAFPIGTAVAIYSYVKLAGSWQLFRESRW